MKLELVRYNFDKESTSGMIFIDGSFEAFTLEDQVRNYDGGEAKVRGESAVEEGTFRIQYQESDTGLTMKYRAKYPWFTKHLMIVGLKHHSGVYLHIGCFEKNTDGCPLIADQANNDPKNYAATQYQSTVAFQRFYGKVCKALDAREPVSITIGSIGNNKLIFGNHV